LVLVFGGRFRDTLFVVLGKLKVAEMEYRKNGTTTFK